MDTVDVEVDDRLAVVAINRPEVRNAEPPPAGGPAGGTSVEAIDTACRTALGYPTGPVELMDLTVSALVERGELGRKTGTGFYTYDDQGRRHSRPDHETDT